MGRNSGKQRKGKFAPPKVPKPELKAHQCYGVITKYHGGAQRNMDVTIYNAETNSLMDVKCKLKGSLRHSKCKQRIQIGSYVVTDYEDVIIIFTPNQYPAGIPETIYSKLYTVCSGPEEEEISFTPDYNDIPSEEEAGDINLI
jgi:hypothetical protein